MRQQANEGVVQFHLEHTITTLKWHRNDRVFCQLAAWREIMAQTNLLGKNQRYYQGAGYGNVSGRLGPPSQPRGQRAMLISGTQTSGYREICLDDFCVVERYDAARNWVKSRGQTPPSSETLTHGAIYDLSPRIRFVLHAHSPSIWQQATALRIPITAADVLQGTPEMAQEVHRLYKTTSLGEKRILCMGGHEDGVIAFGHTVAESGQTLLTFLSFANEMALAARGR